MKQIFVIAYLLGNTLLSDAQTTLYQASDKFNRYYIELQPDQARIYKIARYLDKAGTGYLMQDEDTLTKQADGSYIGHRSAIRPGKDMGTMTFNPSRKSGYKLETPKTADVNYILNNAYYLDQYFDMSRELQTQYPSTGHSFRSGFAQWDAIPDKNMEHQKFRTLADRQIKAMKDSILQYEQRLSMISDQLLKNIKTIDYKTVKEGVAQLPSDYQLSSKYFRTVINELAKQQPGYFLQLADEFPGRRDQLFWAVDKVREVRDGVNAVNGYEKIKKAFYKERK
jgi:hypothetical protein